MYLFINYKVAIMVHKLIKAGKNPGSNKRQPTHCIDEEIKI